MSEKKSHYSVFCAERGQNIWFEATDGYSTDDSHINVYIRAFIHECIYVERHKVHRLSLVLD